jgi:hypothetical protein
MSDDAPTYGESAMNAVSAEAQAVIAFMDDVRKMRKLAAAIGTLDPTLAADTKKLNTQIARSLQRQRRILQSMLDRGDGTAEDRIVAAEFIRLLIDAQAELHVGVVKAVN